LKGSATDFFSAGELAALALAFAFVRGLRLHPPKQIAAAINTNNTAELP
jgi:hypothetical protein